MFWHSEEKPCQVCKSKDELIEYLKADLERKTKEWKNEREEYKRTVDRLLLKENIAPVGQGAEKPPVDISSMLNIFEAETKDVAQ